MNAPEKTRTRPRRVNTHRLPALLALIAVGADAQAYLDPGTGSMLLQLILGGFAAAGVALKLYWHRIKAALGFGKDSDASER